MRSILRDLVPLDKLECKHQFFEVQKAQRDIGDMEIMGIKLGTEYGVKVACALCNEKRILWSDSDYEKV